MVDERVPSDLKKNLMQARLDKKMTQAQLAQVMIIGVWPSNKWGNLLFSDSNEWQHNIKVDVSQKILSFPKMRWKICFTTTDYVMLEQMINEKPQVIQEYESGKAIPNQQIISKLERALGTKLRGKK